MKIRYDNTLDDMVAFNRFHVAHSPALRSQRTVQAILAWLIPSVATTPWIFAVSQWVDFDDVAGVSIFYFVIGLAITAIVLWARHIRRRIGTSIDRCARRMYREGANKGMLTTHELELTPTSLIERTEFGETTTKLVAVVGDYTFIYLTALTAHVIPRQAVSVGDYETFVAAIAGRVDTTVHGDRET
jgi:hypothetical protein